MKSSSDVTERHFWASLTKAFGISSQDEMYGQLAAQGKDDAASVYAILKTKIVEATAEEKRHFGLRVFPLLKRVVQEETCMWKDCQWNALNTMKRLLGTYELQEITSLLEDCQELFTRMLDDKESQNDKCSEQLSALLMAIATEVRERKLGRRRCIIFVFVTCRQHLHA